MKSQKVFLKKLVATLFTLLMLGPFVNPLRALPNTWNDGTPLTADADDSITLTMDANENGIGSFSIIDKNGADPNITTIFSDAQSTVITAVGITTNSLTVDGINGTTIAGATNLGSTLGVTGLSTLSGGITADGIHISDASSGLNNISGVNTLGATTVNATTVNAGALNTTGDANVGGALGVAGLASLDGGIDVNGGKFTVETNGNTSVGGNLTVTGTTNTITGSTSSSMTGGNAGVNLSTNNASMSVTGGGAVTVTNTQVSALTADGLGLIVDDANDRTTLSGGTNTTTFTVDNDGAKFANSAGDPVKVTGVADGVGDFDAVNMRQFRELEDDVEDAYSGIASVAALAAIPPPAPGKNFSLGIGYGNFDTESAIAVGGKMLVGEQKDITLGGGVGFSESETVINAGIGWSF